MTLDCLYYFRPMYQRDIEAIELLEKQLNPTPWSTDQLIKSLEMPRYACHVMVTDQDKIIGYFIAMHGIDWSDLLLIGVSPAYQQKGFGTLLLKHLAQLINLYGNKGVFLEVRQSNLAALRLYQKVGFKIAGKRKNYYDTSMGKEDAFTMIWEWIPPEKTDGKKTNLKRIWTFTPLATE